jgi:hypothetical protein
MANDLRYIPTDLKNAIASKTKIGDYVSTIWFSGAGEFGPLQEAYQITSARSFTPMFAAIDNFLKPVGMTSFEGPLQLAKNLADKYRNIALPQIMFMTDGCDNQSSSTANILKAAKALRGIPTVIVEKGWHCNRQFLMQLAKEAGGQLVFRENYRDFMESVSASLAGEDGVLASLLPTVEITVEPGTEAALTVLDGGNIVALEISDNHVVRVPEGKTLVTVGCCSSSSSTTEDEEDILQRAAKKQRVDDSVVLQEEKTAILGKYVALHYLLQQVQIDIDQYDPKVWDCLRSLGDVELLNEYNDCFTKQDYSNLQDLVLKKRIQDVDGTQWFAKGRDENVVLQNDGFTVLDALYALQNDSEARFDPFHPEFQYKRVSRARVEKEDDKDEEAEDADDDDELGGCFLLGGAAVGLEKLKKLRAASKPVFEVKQPTLVPISKLSFNETRANVSILVCLQGNVHMVGQNGYDDDLVVPTHGFKQYTIVLDGIVHSAGRHLPVTVSEATFQLFQSHRVLPVNAVYVPGQVYVLDLSHLKVMNRNMVRSVNAKEAFELAVRVHQLKTDAKFVGAMLTKNFEESGDEESSAPSKKEKVLVLKNRDSVFGQWVQETVRNRMSTASTPLSLSQAEMETQLLTELKEKGGVTESGGYSPKKVSAPVQEYYEARELTIKIAKCSSIPTVNAKLLKKLTDTPGKTTFSESLMLDIFNEHQQRKKQFSGDEKELNQWLEDKLQALRAQTKIEAKKLIDLKWSILAGKRWFVGRSLADGAVSEKVEMFGKTFECTADVRVVQEKL